MKTFLVTLAVVRDEFSSFSMRESSVHFVSTIMRNTENYFLAVRLLLIIQDKGFLLENLATNPSVY